VGIVRAVLQRVTRASVAVWGQTVAAIGPGLVVLLGVAQGDGPEQARRLAAKTAELRIFAGDPSTSLRASSGRFDRSLPESGGEALVVSQFTLLADVRKGRRPSFVGAAAPEAAEPLVESYAAALRELGARVQTGRFGAHMVVALENDGPVTIVLDSEDLERPRRQQSETRKLENL
jgi:D-tyrosyl-tRNA(Tyr) deacylase